MRVIHILKPNEAKGVVESWVRLCTDGVTLPFCKQVMCNTTFPRCGESSHFGGEVVFEDVQGKLIMEPHMFAKRTPGAGI